MFWRAHKYAVETTVQFLRRMFTYNTSWVNSGLEIVQVGSGGVFEQYFEEAERYPFISVGSQGGAFSGAGINNIIQEFDANGVIQGDRGLLAVLLDDTGSLSVQLRNVSGSSIRGLWTSLAFAGYGSGGGDIAVQLYKNNPFTILSSGSIPGTETTSYASQWVEFCPIFTTSSTDNLWVRFTVSSGSLYNFSLDTTHDSQYTLVTSQGTTTGSGSLMGSVVTPVFTRIGGRVEPTVVIRCSSKNSTAAAYDLAELSSQYLQLAKHAKVSRDANALNAMTLGTTGTAVSPEWFSKLLFIKSVRQGPVEVRPRGENDKIFTVSLTVDFLGEWYQDYPAESMQEGDLTITTF